MKRFGLLLCGLFLVCSCTATKRGSAQPELPLQLVYLESDGISIPILVEVANTSEQMARGLMFRRSLSRERGMLFLFPIENQLHFWMKNTLIPLDILFFNADRELVSSATMLPCEEDPCVSYSSEMPSTYALEVNAGFLLQHSIGKGWKIELQ
ncbi:hypothetical protein COU76_02895 [Candidatus Peregrinibacteria bacterium CG10_big_fil_rev_8_21_14_0_10_49_10]|nr:MAG: hypothetical protein COU76_02895 [Candidatus Peregrinibacteria bacterium CG10_big_fil_rev_8_21_14_0_10_49_10]